MNKTQKILRFIKDESPDCLYQIQNYVKAINGTSYSSNQGYYTSNLHRMVEQGLLEKEGRGVYRVTELGDRYITDKLEVIRLLRSRNNKRFERATDQLKRLIQAIEEGEYNLNDVIDVKIKI